MGQKKAEELHEELRIRALTYHRLPRPGKIEIQPTKPLANQHDLSLAYSPGVAAACEAIVEDRKQAALLTGRQNLVAVITNGTAVLGLGDIGPLAAKPVMEGKAVLFKKFGGIDVFDIELAEKDVDRLADLIAALEPTFGGINLEDIKAPECFALEEKLRQRMNIPVFHDDQHGTAIIVGAAVLNGLALVGKSIGEVKLVTSGAGAAALACLNLLVSLGVEKKNIFLTDLEGVVYAGRQEYMDPWKEVYAQETEARHLSEIIAEADIFLGVSAGGVLKPDMVQKMAPDPLILALANPYPEILPSDALAVRPDAILCTGRSDYPNQVNNALCFPYIFRGALDTSASCINEAMKIAAVHALASLAREAPSEVVAQAYGGEFRTFGKDSLIPTPFDPRLLLRIAPAVAEAARQSGVAQTPIEDLTVYTEFLSRSVFRSGFLMKPIFVRAKADPKRVIYADGEDERVLRATQVILEEGLARPILIGRPQVIHTRLKRFGLSLVPDQDFTIINPEDDPRYREYVHFYSEVAGREGISLHAAKTLVRTNSTVIAALALRRGDGDALLCGLEGGFHAHLKHIKSILGIRETLAECSAVSLILTGKGAYFLADTHVCSDPTAETLCGVALLCAEHVKRFGLDPKIAFLSHSNFGEAETESARKMRRTMTLLRREAPGLMADGEMQADMALSPNLRDQILPSSFLEGEANILILPNLDAANIAFTLTKALANALPIGPILLGPNQPAHILTPSVTARGIVNMTAIAVAEVGSGRDFLGKNPGLLSVKE